MDALDGFDLLAEMLCVCDTLGSLLVQRVHVWREIFEGEGRRRRVADLCFFEVLEGVVYSVF